MYCKLEFPHEATNLLVAEEGSVTNDGSAIILANEATILLVAEEGSATKEANEAANSLVAEIAQLVAENIMLREVKDKFDTFSASCWWTSRPGCHP